MQNEAFDRSNASVCAIDFIFECGILCFAEKFNQKETKSWTLIKGLVKQYKKFLTMCM